MTPSLPSTPERMCRTPRASTSAAAHASAPTMQVRMMIALALMLLALALTGCTRDEARTAGTAAARPEVLDGGARVRIPAGPSNDTLFATITAASGIMQAEVTAPAHVAARAVHDGSGPMVMFDMPDITSLYSSYIQYQSTLAREQNDLQRMKDLFDHQAATSRDVMAAQTDVANARAALAEVEGKLRATGFNPSAFATMPSGTVLLISDVPEALLNEVTPGERTRIEFNSFPGETFTGRVEAIGDVLDNATRTVKVRVSLMTTREIRPGMFATVGFGQSSSAALMVPLGAVFTVLGKDYVFIRSSGHEFTRREVQLGKQVGGAVAVLAGVAPGEQIVTRNTMLLKGLSVGY